MPHHAENHTQVKSHFVLLLLVNNALLPPPPPPQQIQICSGVNFDQTPNELLSTIGHVIPRCLTVSTVFQRKRLVFLLPLEKKKEPGSVFARTWESWEMKTFHDAPRGRRKEKEKEEKTNKVTGRSKQRHQELLAIRSAPGAALERMLWRISRFYFPVMSHSDPAQTMLRSERSEMTIRFLNVNLESDTWNIQRLSWGSSHPDVSAPPFVPSTSTLFTYLSEHQSISSLRFIKLLFPHPVFYRDLEPLLFIHVSMHQKCTLRCPVEPHRLLPNKHTTPPPKHTSYTLVIMPSL